jgi:hypothetical protein
LLQVKQKVAHSAGKVLAGLIGKDHPDYSGSKIFKKHRLNQHAARDDTLALTA